MTTRLRTRGWIAAIVALVVGACVFVARGPLRADESSRWDSILLMSAARTWAEGRNPYVPAEVDKTWAAMGGGSAFAPSFRKAQSFVYPPTGWAILAPWSFGGAKVATIAWVMTGAVLYVASVLMMARLARLPWREPLTWMFVALGLCVGAAHSGIMLGQTANLTLFLVVGGLLMEEQRRPIAAGILLGLAAALKPQMGALFVLYPLLRGRWSVVIGAGVAGLVALAIGVGRLWIAGVPWFEPWKANVTALAQDHGNPLAPGVEAFQLINLQSPLALMLGDVAKANYVAWGALAAVCGAYWVVDRSGGGWREEGERLDGAPELASLTLVSCVSLLAAYRHYYDAVFVIIPLALAAAEWRLGRRGRAMMTFALALPLVVPGPAGLFAMAARGWIPESIAGATWWKVGPMAMHTWALLALCVWMIVWRALPVRKGVREA